MNRTALWSLFLMFSSLTWGGPPVSAPVLGAARESALRESYGKLPLDFEANRGQTNVRAKFLSRIGPNRLFLGASDAYWRLRGGRGSSGATVRMKLLKANRDSTVRGLDQLPGRSSYFIGRDSSKWQTDIEHYRKVEYQNIYPGVNLVYHGTQQQLEYDFVVKPGADPNRIALKFTGTRGIALDSEGNLLLHTSAGDLVQKKPVVWQHIGGAKQEIASAYKLHRDHSVSFQIASFDSKQPLVIDPVVVYATFLGGTGNDDAEAITVDSAGNAYVTGATASINFPVTTDAYSKTLGNPPIGPDGPEEDAFVTKLNPSGTALIFSTYLGGNDNDQGNGIALDSSGNIYVAGNTSSTNFPVTSGTYHFQLGTDAAGEPLASSFVTKLNPTGSALIYSTYFHKAVGSQFIATKIIAMRVLGGNVYIAGNTEHQDDPNNNDGYLAQLNAGGTGLVYFFPISGGGANDTEVEGLFLDAAGNAYVAGETSGTGLPTSPDAFQRTYGGGMLDGFVIKVNPSGSAFLFSTYLGGPGDESAEDVAVDGAGNVFVTGQTSGTFPTTAGAYRTTRAGGIDAFVLKLNPSASALIFSTYVGGSNTDYPDKIAIDGSGIYITGSTRSADFPTTPNAPQPKFGGGPSDGDVFLAKLNLTGSALLFSTYLGGTGDEHADGLALDASGNVYLAGGTSSNDFPVTSGAFQKSCGMNGSCVAGPDESPNFVGDAFVAKIDIVGGTPTTITAVSGQLQSGGAGTRLPAPLIVKVVDGRNAPVAGATVTFAATNATVNPTSAITDATGSASTQITLGPSTGTATIVATSGGASATFSIPVGTAAPQVTLTSVVNGASFAPTIQDGSWTTLIGTNLAPTSRTWNADTEIVNGILPTSLDGVSVTIDGKPVSMYFISDKQVNVLAPTTGKTGPVEVVITNALGSAKATATVMKYSPGLFLFDPQNRKYPAALIARADGGVDYLGPEGLFGPALATRPVKPTEIVLFYATAFGPTNPPVPAGQVFSGSALLDPPGGVTATIGGVDAQVLFAGQTGAGLYQINVIVPDLPSGDAKVLLRIQGLQTQDNVFVPVSKAP